MDTPDAAEIEERLAAYLMEECLPRNSAATLSSDQNLFETGVVDSAGLISFIGFVEREFGMTVPDEDLLPENFVSLSSIARYIRARRQVQHASAQEVRRLGP